jgi:hypothetical protein
LCSLWTRRISAAGNGTCAADSRCRPDIGIRNLERYGTADGMRWAQTRASPSTCTSSWTPASEWDDVTWLRSITRLPLLIKGILTPRIAALALDHGVSGIVVSNHGGRQLDGAMATIDALPAIATRVAGPCALSSSTAAFGAGRTSSRRWRSGRARCSSGARLSLGPGCRRRSRRVACPRDAARRAGADDGARRMPDGRPSITPAHVAR